MPVDLKGLNDDDALALFAHYDVTGSSWQMVDFTRSFENHALLLTLIAGRIRSYAPARGDFDRWYADEGQHLDLRSLDMTQKRHHILSFALDSLSSDARTLLCRLAVFNYPFPFDAAMAVHPFAERYYVAPEPPQPPFSAEEYEDEQRAERDAHDEWLYARSGSRQEARARARRDAIRRKLTIYQDWQSECQRLEQAARRLGNQAASDDVGDALRELEDAGLVAYDFVRRTYDMHPVVRGYSYHELEDDPGGRSAALTGKRNYFETHEIKRPDEINDLSDLRRELEIYDALVQGGRLDEARDFYSRSLRDVLHYELNAGYEIIRLLTPIFPKGFDHYPELAEGAARSACIISLANAYALIGRFEQEMRLRALGIGLTVEARSPYDLGVHITSISISLANQFRYGSAIHAIHVALRLAQAASGADLIAIGQGLLSACYTAIARWDDAEDARSAIDVADFLGDERAYRQAELKLHAAERQIVHGEETATLLAEAERLARTARNAATLRETERLYGEAALQRGDGTAAERHFGRLLEMLQGKRLRVTGARGGLARALLLKGDHRSALEQIKAGSDDLSTAEVMLELGENARAEKAARAAFEELWGEGAPYAHRDVRRAEAVLTALGARRPVLPAFDEGKVQRLPEEDRIMAFLAELERQGE